MFDSDTLTMWVALPARRMFFEKFNACAHNPF